MEKINSDASERRLELKNCRQCGAFFPEDGALDLCVECTRIFNLEMAGPITGFDAYDGEEHNGG